MQWNERANNLKISPLLIIIFSLCLSCIHQAQASDAHSSDADFFSDVKIDAKANHEKGKNNLTGYFQQQLAYSPLDQDYSGFSRQDSGVSQARSTLTLKYQNTFADKVEYELSGNVFYDAYYHSNREDFSNEEYRVMADDVELRNAFINFEALDGLWIKLGKQIVAWGESEFVQIIDMVNPRDQKELGIVDLEDSRIPVWASRFSYVSKRWGTDLVLSHHFEPNKTAGAFSDFDTFISVRESALINNAHDTDVNFSHPDIFYRLFIQGSHSDISFVYANSHQDSALLDIESISPFELQTLYPEIETIGLSANYVYGFWLFKTEIANKSNMSFPKKIPTDSFNEFRSYHQAMLGMEYSGINDVQIASEYIINHIGGNENTLMLDNNDDSFSSRINFQFLNQTVNLEFLLAHWIQGHSDSGRVIVSYDLSDSMKVSLGYIDYRAKKETDSLFVFKNNDRVFASLRYAF